MAYTNIDDPSAYFQTALWTGTGSAGNAVTFDGNSDMQPDFVWSKIISAAFSHVLKDTSRGGTSDNDLNLSSNLTNAESTYAQYRMDFDSDGFTLDGVGDSGFQGSGTSMVSWAWKANGGTTSSNTDGSITSTVQANQDAGFSIVTYTGTGGNITVGHGLGVAPNAIIIKSRSNAAPWVVWTSGMASGTTSVMELNTTGAEQTVSNYWYNGFSSTTFGLGTGSYSHNTNNYTYVAYCFAEKQGYSKFGKYVGNGNANGPFVYTGFKPAFVLIKNASAVTNWYMWDNKRNPYNFVNNGLNPNTNNVTQGTTSESLDFLSNGFKMRAFADGTWNGSGNTYIYMAFAEHPFTTSTGIPTTAR
jgi:hypothetical protein